MTEQEYERLLTRFDEQMGVSATQFVRAMRERARAEQAEAKLLAVEAIKPLTGSEGVTFGAGFASGFNHALELVAEAISSVA